MMRGGFSWADAGPGLDTNAVTGFGPDADAESRAGADARAGSALIASMVLTAIHQLATAARNIIPQCAGRPIEAPPRRVAERYGQAVRRTATSIMIYIRSDRFTKTFVPSIP